MPSCEGAPWRALAEHWRPTGLPRKCAAYRLPRPGRQAKSAGKRPVSGQARGATAQVPNGARFTMGRGNALCISCAPTPSNPPPPDHAAGRSDAGGCKGPPVLSLRRPSRRVLARRVGPHAILDLGSPSRRSLEMGKGPAGLVSRRIRRRQLILRIERVSGDRQETRRSPERGGSDTATLQRNDTRCSAACQRSRRASRAAGASRNPPLRPVPPP